MPNQIKTLDDNSFALLGNVLDEDIFAVMRAGQQYRILSSTVRNDIIAAIVAQLIGKFGVDLTITRLIGGTDTDLDAKPTINLQAGYILLISLPLSDGHSFQAKLMQYHTTAAAGDDIAPLDNLTHSWKQIL